VVDSGKLFYRNTYGMPLEQDLVRGEHIHPHNLLAQPTRAVTFTGSVLLDDVGVERRSAIK